MVRQADAVGPLMSEAQASLMELIQTLELINTMPNVEAEQSGKALDVILKMQERLEQRGLLKARKAIEQLKSLEKADKVWSICGSGCIMPQHTCRHVHVHTHTQNHADVQAGVRQWGVQRRNSLISQSIKKHRPTLTID